MKREHCQCCNRPRRPRGYRDVYGQLPERLRGHFWACACGHPMPNVAIWGGGGAAVLTCPKCLNVYEVRANPAMF